MLKASDKIQLIKSISPSLSLAILAVENKFIKYKYFCPIDNLYDTYIAEIEKNKEGGEYFIDKANQKHYLHEFRKP